MELFVATRPWSFTVSLVPIALANTLAAHFSDQPFSWWTFLVTVLGALSIHAVGNLAKYILVWFTFFCSMLF